MLKKLSFSIILLSLFSFTSLDSKMKKLFYSYLDLLKVVNGTYENERTHYEMQKKLLSIESVLKNSRHDKYLDNSAFAPIMYITELSVNDLKGITKQEYFSLASRRSKLLIQQCNSCHAQLDQLPDDKIDLYQGAFSRYQLTEEQKVQGLYLLRDYKKISKILVEKIKDSIVNLDNKTSMKKTLELLELYLVSIDNVEELKTHLNTFLAKSLEGEYRKHLHIWMNDLETVKNKNTTWLLERVLSKEVDEYFLLPVKRIAVTFFKAKSLLLKELKKVNTDDQNSYYLYWLGVIESQNDFLKLYGTGEYYFRECIQKYPHTSFAKKCYKGFENIITQGFTGSSGTHIPVPVKKEMRELERQIKSKESV